MDVIPDGYLQDAKGRLVPRETVLPEHLLEDELVRELIASALSLSAMLKGFREGAQDRVKAYIDLLAQQYGAKKGGAKGNVSLTSYDGSFKVEIAIGNSLAFGAGLQVAKSLIDECLQSWTADARPELRALIDDAFQVGKAGKLDVDRILSLRRLKIDDERWLRAMEAISDAVRVTSTKEYVRFYQRPAPNADFIQIPLDAARV